MQLSDLRKKLEVLEQKGFEEVKWLEPIGSSKPEITLDDGETLYLEDIGEKQ